MTAERRIAAALGLAGALLYLLFALRLFAEPGNVTFGTQVYDTYFLSLLDGRLDVPLRIIGLEGHYDLEGRAYVYHGLAPLLTRLIAWPLTDLRTAAFSYLSIWLFVVAGTALYHLLLHRLVTTFGPTEPARRRLWILWTGVAVWLCGPGLWLAANDSLFHEPIAAAYLCGAAFLYAVGRLVWSDAQVGDVLVAAALPAALAVHARPHLAIGLYLGCGLLMLHHLIRERPRRLVPLLLSVAILGASGGGLLLWNEVRFGDPTTMHGTFEASELQYGFTYWGVDDPNGPRATAFRETGRFDPRRMLPNALSYGVDLPEGPVADAVTAARDRLVDGRGYFRVEEPRVGVLYLWAPWLLLLVVALSSRRAPPEEEEAGERRPLDARGRSAVRIAVVATAIAAAMLLSYGTVTLRYRADLWPLLVALVLLLLPGLLRSARGRAPSRAFGYALVGTLVVSSIATVSTALAYTDNFASGGVFSVWTPEMCEGMLLRRGEDPARLPELCALPGADGAARP